MYSRKILQNRLLNPTDVIECYRWRLALPLLVSEVQVSNLNTATDLPDRFVVVFVTYRRQTRGFMRSPDTQFVHMRDHFPISSTTVGHHVT